MNTITHRRYRAAILLGFVLLLIGMLLSACGPEADRSRGVGAGADVDNTGDTVDLHGDASAEERIYYQTPRELSENQ